MNQYLLSVYQVEGQMDGPPPSAEEMRAFMGRVIALEEEMDRAGAFAFGGRIGDVPAAVPPGRDGAFAQPKARCHRVRMDRSSRNAANSSSPITGAPITPSSAPPPVPEPASADSARPFACRAVIRLGSSRPISRMSV